MQIHRLKNRAEKISRRWDQRGVIMPLFAVGMLAIIVMAGLALDMSHALLNKSRLQNAVDAAALTAAKVLKDTENMDLARTKALDVFEANAVRDGNQEMASAVARDAVTVEFSATLTPFEPTETPPFVRVTVADFTMDAFLIQILGSDFLTKTVSASAVSGPSGVLDETMCDIAPFIVCKYPTAEEDDPFWGYRQGDVNVLKGSSQSDNGDIGAGNFFMAALGDDPGGLVLAQNAAGGYEGCATVGDEILTEPGVKVAPSNGANQRLDCQGNECGPSKPKLQPDLVTTVPSPELTSPPGTLQVKQGGVLIGDGALDATDRGLGADALDFNYDDYVAATKIAAEDPNNTGAAGRRKMAVIVADCEGKNQGRDNLPIEGFACYFMLQKVGHEGGDSFLFGQFVDKCEGSGVLTPDPGPGPGATKIILYKDADGTDS